MEGPFRIETETYRPLDESAVAAYVAGIPPAAVRLGGGDENWRVREVGDGNLNLVFIVEGPAGGVVVKQALPYMRLVGESWPLPLARSYFESLALIEQQRAAPGRVPRMLGVDRVGAAITMEYLTPHVILRKALIAGRRLPLFAGHMAEFTAAALFKTSDLYLPASRKKGTDAGILRQHRTVQDHRGSGLHRSLSRNAEQSLDHAATRRDRRFIPGGCAASRPRSRN